MIGLLSADEYYEELRRGPILDQLYGVGQFFWAPSLFLFGEHRPYLVRSKYSQTLADYEYQIDVMRQSGEFDAPQEPNHTLGIRSDERAVIVGAKQRPVILISKPVTGWTDRNRKPEESFLVAPVYSFGGNETKTAYSQTFIERVKGYVYWQFFYLPTSNSNRISEGFVRLDRIQAVHKNLLDHMRVILTDEALLTLRNWTRVYLGEEMDAVDDMLFDYREQAIADLKAKGLMP